MMAFRWQTVSLKNAAGNVHRGVAPVIVSASRSTDIPAFYGDWLLNRLRRGYCVWVNPFNGTRQYVSFGSARFFVFWSKNPQPLLKKLREIDRLGVGYYFQFTLNDYDNELCEAHVPSVASRVDTFKRLADQIGPSRVIWRFDPLLLTDAVSVQVLLDRAERLTRLLHRHTEKCVFSFADLVAYQKVRQNLLRRHVAAREFTADEMVSIGSRLGDLGRSYGLRVATCAEKIDLTRFGIEPNRCIDDELMARCCPGDATLMAFLGRNTGPIQSGTSGKSSPGPMQGPRSLKDPGQRACCGCVLSKDIGAYNTCPHDCIYCYATSSPEWVDKRFRAHDPEAESI
jgi:hypothetical protein